MQLVDFIALIVAIIVIGGPVLFFWKVRWYWSDKLLFALFLFFGLPLILLLTGTCDMLSTGAGELTTTTECSIVGLPLLFVFANAFFGGLFLFIGVPIIAIIALVIAFVSFSHHRSSGKKSE